MFGDYWAFIIAYHNQEIATTWTGNICSLIPRSHPKNPERASVDHYLSKVPTMQYGRVAHDGIICVSYMHAAVVLCLREIGVRSKSESTIHPNGLLRQTPRSSVGTGLGPDQLRRSVGICV